ncbi:protein of unknown function [Catalinimonas alkaloidigena]|uniref:PA14 domain-containing protein n=1 Tax=Catalinimonas alkaloidigena TaxID=1075417 RepID=A0A1G9KHB8_9BACT|nr:DUF1080 domain-containing protein [Catalinimonas alkaloidigena]SDL48986.1 protein of unknown function [Catalinimonas alkaloidigena]
MIRRTYFSFGLYLLLLSGGAFAQTPEIPYTPLNLQNFNDFRPVGKNWKIVGNVFYDLREGGKGKTERGTGVAVNAPTEKQRDHLMTQMEHGDLDLELDFMMDKGSNAGVYLQGRYEVQLFDSWGVQNPTAADCGAIYERWDEGRPSGRKGYEGHAPAQNVSKAPGLWQRYRILFRAPRFDAQGNKTENARFVKVIHNGVTIHENVEVTGPTRSAAFEDEQPTGPLMIQGDHGPVAIRNLRYKAYGTEPVTLKGMKLSTYDGEGFKSIAQMVAQKPKAQQDIPFLEHAASGSKENFGGKIAGTLHLPTSGTYVLSLNLKWLPPEVNLERLNGAGQLKIDGKEVLSLDGSEGGTALTTLDLQSGDHPLELAYYKNFGFWYARSTDITLAVEGPGVPYTILNAPVRAAEPVGEIEVEPAGRPTMLRSFMNHNGTKRTHVISVGEPGGANYAMDLQYGELLQFWRGDFLETTLMWYGRGETQLAVPQGSVIELAGQPSVAMLADQNATWPDSNDTYKYLGYDVTKAGRPVFKYALDNAEIHESFEPADDGKKLVHALEVTGGGDGLPLWCRLSEGKTITKLPNGLYAVNDKEYFIEIQGSETPVLRTTARNTQELLLPIKGGPVKYAIVW